jgi:hypothetical protein
MILDVHPLKDTWFLVKNKRGKTGYVSNNNFRNTRLTFIPTKSDIEDYDQRLLKVETQQLDSLKQSLRLTKKTHNELYQKLADITRAMEDSIEQIEQVENTIKRIKQNQPLQTCVINELPEDILVDILIFSQAKLCGQVCKLWDKLIATEKYQKRLAYWIETGILNNFCISYVLERCLRKGVPEINFLVPEKAHSRYVVKYDTSLGWFSIKINGELEHTYYKRFGVIMAMEHRIRNLTSVCYKSSEPYEDSDSEFDQETAKPIQTKDSLTSKFLYYMKKIAAIDINCIYHLDGTGGRRNRKLLWALDVFVSRHRKHIIKLF